jgi:pantoate--beta-alanine ligase
MRTITQIEDLRREVALLRESGARIALVPTMGALHEGHLTLVRRARKEADHVIASIFVNPTQFGANEDLDSYPRRMAEDARALDGEGVAILWAPDVAEMYPAGFSTRVIVDNVSAEFCGASRPGHFDGVGQVVLKLFNQVQPDIAVFGEKDWQQLAVIRRMARDLDLTCPRAEAILGQETVREADGLAMSSRNQYLDARERQAAATLPAAMREAIAAIEAGSAPQPTLAALEAHLLQAGFASVDYAALADAASLERLEAPIEGPMRLMVAARIGTTRLIDNMPVVMRT